MIDNGEHRTTTVSEKKIDIQVIADLLFFNSNQAHAIFDNNFKILKTNKAFSVLFGYNKVSLNNTYLSSLPFVTEHDDFLGLTEKLEKGEIPKFSLDVKIPSLERGLYIYQVSFSSNWQSGLFSGGLLSIQNITQQHEYKNLIQVKNKELEQKKEELKKFHGLSEQLQSFAYIASHDLKEPLRTIGNFSQLLERQSNGYIDDRGREYLTFIRDGVKNMNALIDDLMLYSTLDTRLHVNQISHLPTVMFMLTKMHEHELNQVNATVEIGEMPENVIVDKSKFRLLWECLLSNAIKYRRKDVPLKIKITGKTFEKYWEFTIQDNGIGIKEEYFTKIFEMFKKLHGKKDFQGTGIGLAICKKIVEHHHGKIFVKSTEQSGSTFCFTLMKPS